MRNFVQPGKVIAVTAPYALASGAGCLVGAIFGVAEAPAANAAPVQIRRVGVVTLPKASGAINQGDKLYWDNTNMVVTTTASGNTKIGAAVLAALSGDAIATLVLIPVI